MYLAYSPLRTHKLHLAASMLEGDIVEKVSNERKILERNYQAHFDCTRRTRVLQLRKIWLLLLSKVLTQYR